MGLTNSKTYAEAVKVADHDAHQVDLSAGFHHGSSTWLNETKPGTWKKVNKKG